jgi:hypothetical protein
LLGGRYMLGLTSALFASIALTVADFVTSFVALNEGFAEGNSLLTGLSKTLSLGTISSLLVMKAIFIAGVSTLAVIGTKSRDRTTKKLMLASLGAFVVLFAFVSVNNLYWLLS